MNAQARSLADAKARRAALPVSDTAAISAADAEIAAGESALAELRQQLADAEQARNTAAAREGAANERLSQALATLKRAQLNVASGGEATSVGGDADAGQGREAAAVSEAVTRIVAMVLAEAGRGEGCNAIFRDFTVNHQRYIEGAGLNVLDLCLRDRQASSDALLRAVDLPVR